MLEITDKMCYCITVQRGCSKQILFNPTSDTVAVLDYFHR